MVLLAELPGLHHTAEFFPLFPAGKVGLFARHYAARMEDEVEYQGYKHGRRVEDIHVDFVVGNRRMETRRVLDETEYDTDGNEDKYDVGDVE